MSLLSDASTYYSQGDSIPISLGMKHAEDYYWVGQTTIDLTENEIEYTGTQVLLLRNIAHIKIPTTIFSN